jgi:hypothetical protein
VNPIKLFAYANAKTPIHESIEWYREAVPFCQQGRERWVEWVEQDKADFIWCGQIRQEEPNPFLHDQFPLLREHPERHIVELEGDFVDLPTGHPNAFREDFPGTIRIACGAPQRWRGQTVFPRPSFSRYLLHAARDMHTIFPEPINHGMGFMGYNDQHSIRRKVSQALTGLPPAKFDFTAGWQGTIPIGHISRTLFENRMMECSMALCPQGNGVATARFYEACFYTRCPIIIGETMLLGEDQFDVSFAPQVNAWLPVEELREELRKIGTMSLAEAAFRGRQAREYFDAVVRRYFEDPTQEFLRWMERRGIVNKLGTTIFRKPLTDS